MVRRKLFTELQAHLPKREFSIITGARQTGKSTLLRQLEEECKARNIPVIFLNLENRLILAALNESPLNLLQYLPAASERVVALIDEVQYLDDPSHFLKLLYDEYADKLKIVASGSSAFYIDDRFRDSLAGRKRLFHLYTCSFDEYLEIAGETTLLQEYKTICSRSDYKSIHITLLRFEYEKFMLYGGYPAVVADPDRSEKVNRLKEIRDSFIKRDMLESGVQNEAAFYKLFRLLAAQTGNLVNVNELSSTLQIKNETVANYLIIMQKCFYISLVSPFFKNIRKELTKMQKVYLLDTGLRNCLLNNFQLISERPDKGELWENMVFRLLADKNAPDDIYYWRTSAGNEVDFVLPAIEKPMAIEAKFDIKHVKTVVYKLFTSTYPELPIRFVFMSPFDEDFFRQLN